MLMKKLSICMLIGMLAFETAACGGKTVQEPILQETLELRAGCFRVEGTVQAEEDFYGIREYILWEKPQLKPEESILYRCNFI